MLPPVFSRPIAYLIQHVGAGVNERRPIFQKNLKILEKYGIVSKVFFPILANMFYKILNLIWKITGPYPGAEWVTTGWTGVVPYDRTEGYGGRSQSPQSERLNMSGLPII